MMPLNWHEETQQQALGLTWVPPWLQGVSGWTTHWWVCQAGCGALWLLPGILGTCMHILSVHQHVPSDIYVEHRLRQLQSTTSCAPGCRPRLYIQCEPSRGYGIPVPGMSLGHWYALIILPFALPIMRCEATCRQGLRSMYPLVPSHSV